MPFVVRANIDDPTLAVECRNRKGSVRERVGHMLRRISQCLHQDGHKLSTIAEFHDNGIPERFNATSAVADAYRFLIDEVPTSVCHQRAR